MVYLLLVITLIFGIILRLANISQFKIYPDSYQILIVAENILKYRSVVGLLGHEGMLFPPFFGWSRPGFPLLIDFFRLFMNNRIQPAQILSFASSVLAIPVSFYFIKKISGSGLMALSAAVIMSLSFNHIVWSGFILTEAPAVLLMLLLLLSLSGSFGSKTVPDGKRNMITGAILAMAVLFRFEYLLLTAPLVFLIFQYHTKPFRNILHILITAILVLTLFAGFLFPLKDAIEIIWVQNRLQLNLFILSLAAVPLFGYFFRSISTRWMHFISITFSILFTAFFIIISLYALLQSVLPGSFPFWHGKLEAFRVFLRTDFLIPFLLRQTVQTSYLQQ